MDSVIKKEQLCFLPWDFHIRIFKEKIMNTFSLFFPLSAEVLFYMILHVNNLYHNGVMVNKRQQCKYVFSEDCFII